MAATRPVPGLSAERRFYRWAAAVTVVVAVGGFARTYYLKTVFATPPLSALIHVHAALMTAWIALLLALVQRVAARRTDLHRRLGVAGVVLACAILVVGVATAAESARRGITVPGMTPAIFLVLPLATVAVFAVLVAAAIAWRRRSDIHKRLMLLATLSILTPAIARIPWQAFRDVGPPLFIGLTDLCILAFVAFDTARNRRLHPAFGWGTAFVLVSQPLRIALAHTAAWERFAAWIIG
jgi:hypothetical protein